MKQRDELAGRTASECTPDEIDATVGVVWTPGCCGQRSAAWAVDPAPGGAVAVQIHTSDFTDAAVLNKEFQRHGARTVVMVQSAPAACRTAVPSDVDVEQRPDRLPWSFREAALAVRHVPSCVPNLEYDAVVGPQGLTLRT